MPYCPAVEPGAPRGDSRTPAKPPRHPELHHPPCAAPFPRSPIVCLASPRPGGHVRLQLPERPGRRAAGGPGDWCRALSEPGAGAGAVGGGKGGVGRCPSPDKERVGHAEQAAPPAEHEGVSAQRAGLSFTWPLTAAAAEGRGLVPPPHQELGAGREAGPAGARPEASAASSRQRGREKERLGRDWGRAERASEEEKGGHSCPSGRGREWGRWGRRCGEGSRKAEGPGRPAEVAGGEGGAVGGQRLRE